MQRRQHRRHAIERRKPGNWLTPASTSPASSRCTPVRARVPRPLPRRGLRANRTSVAAIPFARPVTHAVLPRNHGRGSRLLADLAIEWRPTRQEPDQRSRAHLPARRRGQNDGSGDRTASQPTRLARIYRRLGARSPGTSRSLSAMWSAVARYPAGRERSQPALNGRAHALTACVPPFRVVCDASDQDRRSG
jgi:hypothetical protein